MLQHAGAIDLGGTWRFRTDPDNLGEHFEQQLDIPWQFDARWMRNSYDDSGWAEIPVPSCWQAEGYDYNGVAWYRKGFALPGSSAMNGLDGQRFWFRFEGVDYIADAWINEHYLGSHEGYFAAFEYEVTPYLRSASNLLAVRVDSPSDISTKEAQTGQLKSLIKGALQRWDVNNPEINPGGIWNEVKLIPTGPGAITDVRIHTQLPTLPSHPDASAPGIVVVELHVAGFPVAASPQTARLHVSVAPQGFSGPGAESVLPIAVLQRPSVWQVSLPLDEVRLWSTWDIGIPHLYTLQVTLEVDGAASDRITQRFGFRRIERREGWETWLNGHRIFQRGANYLSDQLLSTMTAERYAVDVELLKKANLNTVHPFCVVEKQAFYDECDRAGILVYQDFPMWLMMNNSSDLVRRASSQMRDLIAQFGHHPCIGVWNMGSQPSVANFEKLGAALAQTARELDPTRIIHQANALVDLGTQDELPDDPIGRFHWTERAVSDFQQRFDWRVDTHQYRGWYSKRMEDLASVPLEHLQLVTEYGAQALPSRQTLQSMLPAEALFPPVWSFYTRRCFQPEYQFLFISEPQSLEQFIQDSQGYQARFIQYHTEHYRRHKFQPCNGAHLFCFNDCWNAITWSVVDYSREPKAGFFALQRAMAPLQAFLELEDGIKTGIETKVPVWLVNDFPRSFGNLVLRWTISDSSTGELPCSIAANDLQIVGYLHWTFASTGSYTVDLQLFEDGQPVAENRYTLTVKSD